MSEPSSPSPQPLSESAHPRTFRANRYVYAVLSRRAGGVSAGVNLNPDKVCNFGCIYCQVDRREPRAVAFTGLEPLLAELEALLTGLKPGGALWREPEFAGLPPEKRVVRDVAFSGDGEPTTFRNFAEVVRRTVEVKERLGFREPKVVLITNATGLQRPGVRTALRFLDGHGGEVWAKLDAGTPGYFRRVNRTNFPFQRILGNILACAKERAVVMQSCFMRLSGAGPDEGEIGAYIERLRALTAAGGRVLRVQVYTISRAPAFGIVSSLPDAEVERIAERVRAEAGLPAQAFFGSVPEGRGLRGASDGRD